MAQIGSQPSSWNSFAFTGLNNLNQVGMGTFSMPEAGRITSVACFFGGHTAATNARLVLWDSSGNILAQTATFSVAQGSGGSGGQSWQTQSLTSPVLAASGAAYYIGFWRDPAKDAEWSINTASGTWYDNTNTSGSPGAFTGLTSNSGSVGAYATYVPLRVWARRSGAWVAAFEKVQRSGVRTDAPTRARRSGAWTQVS